MVFAMWGHATLAAKMFGSCLLMPQQLGLYHYEAGVDMEHCSPFPPDILD
jgi:hypothetical protein